MAALTTRWLAGAVAALASAPSFAAEPDALLRASTDLLAAVQAEADRTALAARELGRGMSVRDREALQSACSAVVAAPDDVRAERRLRQQLGRYRNADPDALLRLCLDPAYRRLQSDIRTTAVGLERLQTTGVSLRTGEELEQQFEEQRRRFEIIQSVARMLDDAARDGPG